MDNAVNIPADTAVMYVWDDPEKDTILFVDAKDYPKGCSFNISKIKGFPAISSPKVMLTN